MTTGLTRLTVQTPQRRLDLVLPEQVPVAELLPELLSHGGSGEDTGGWMLRRVDGTSLAAAQGLASQGIRDGAVLHLVPTRLEWPEPAYDDVAEQVAAGVRRLGGAWSVAATRVAALAVAGLVLAAGLPLAPHGLVLVGVAAALLITGTVASRVRQDGCAGAALGGFALPYAFVGGVLLGPDETVAQVLVGAGALSLASVVGLASVAAGRWLFTAGVTLGLVGGVTALAGHFWQLPGAAAGLACVLVCAASALPWWAVRLGRVPVRPSPAGDPVFVAVDRADELLTGALIGWTILGVAAVGALLATGGLAAAALAALTAVALVLRSRLFVTVRQRLPMLVGGVAGLVAVAAALLADTPGEVRTGAVVLMSTMALAIVISALVRRDRPFPVFGRAADLAETLVVVSVVPVTAAVLDLYPRLP